MGGIGATYIFRIAKIVPFLVPLYKIAAMVAILKFPSKPVNWIEPKPDGKHWSDIEIQNCLNRYVWLSKMAAWASILKILKQHLFPKKVREKSRECHNHKPQPFPDPKRKRKPTNLNKHKPNKRTKSTKISSLFPKRGNRNTKRTEKHKKKMTHVNIQQIAS